MHLEEIQLVNFRNLKTQTLTFKNEVVVLWGDNAQGKTNLLEAIYLLSNAKSFRTRVDHELITWGVEDAKVVGKADNLLIELTINQQKKELRVNKQPKRLTELIGSFITILFTPNDVGLVSGSPLERRSFLDRLCSNLSREYLYNLVAFNKILRSRNFVLFKLSQGAKDDISVWDEQLSPKASFIWNFRKETIEKLNIQLVRLGKSLLKADLTLEYENPLLGENLPKTSQNLVKRLRDTFEEELSKKQTLTGPHRDNFKIILDEEKEEKVVSKDLGIYGSRGEQRSASLAMKLAEVGLIEEEKKVTPVLLLDEVLSELDENHRQLLLRQIQKGQTFITSTTFESVKSVLKTRVTGYEVVDGSVKNSKVD